MPRWLVHLTMGGWRSLPHARALETAYIAGMFGTTIWLAMVDDHGIEGMRRLLLIPADIILVTFWPVYWPIYLLL